jgi:hypothetical protein
LEEDQIDNAFFIQAYFDELEQRIAFLKELNEGGHKSEALMLCCCYIEALGTRKYHEPEKKSKNYSQVLQEYGGNDLFEFVHPEQLKRVLANQKLFKPNFFNIEPIINSFGNELLSKEVVVKRLLRAITREQLAWLRDNMFKATIAAVSYEWVRGNLVHHIGTGDVTFDETMIKGNAVPDLNFELLYPALRNIFLRIKDESLQANCRL